MPGVAPVPGIPAPGPPLAAVPVNLAHLDRLSSWATVGGRRVLLTRIYCEAPDYRPVGAPGEGIAALDDVARAALVYLDHWAATGDRDARDRARGALDCALALGAGGGAFYNFVRDEAGAVNRSGPTSRAGLDWWTCRALVALARGYAAFRAPDPAYAAELRAAYRATEALVAARTGPVGTWATVGDARLPAWLPAGSAALAALAALALADFQETAPNARTATLLTALADGLAACQLGGPGRCPWGLHPHSLAAPLPWHAWGAHEAAALARAGAVLGRTDWVAAARREVDGFFAWQLAGGHLHLLDPLPLPQGQQAYGIGCQVAAAVACYRATGQARYARLAGLHAAWFTGNNPARAPMYDPATGRGYDGIDRAGAVNPHAGAESTIEALLALGAVNAIPEARRYLHHRPLDGHGWRVIGPAPGEPPADAEARVRGLRFFPLATPREVAVTIAEPGDYLLYAALRRPPGADAATVTAQLDGGPAVARPVTPAPDRDFPWLEPLTPRPVALAAGRHRLRLAAEAGAPADAPGLAGLLLHPVPLTRRFVGPDGARLELRFDPLTGTLDWRE